MGAEEAQDVGEVSEVTRQFERLDAEAMHQPDRLPTPEEERAADDDAVDDGVREHYEEMIETGANVKGEGAID